MKKNHIPESEYPEVSRRVSSEAQERYGKSAGLRSVDNAIYYWERVVKKEKELTKHKQIEDVFEVAERKILFFTKLKEKKNG